MRRLAAATLLATLGFFLVGFRIFAVRSGPNGTANSTCAECHGQIYRDWQRSAHSRSFSSERFARRSKAYTVGECLPCHVPVTSQETPLTTRTWSQDTGVDCISCHVLRNAVRGPYDVDAAHRTIKDSRFLDNRACQQCHSNSVRELQEAPGSLGKDTCQSCHMPTRKQHIAGGVYQLTRKRKLVGHHAFDLAALLREAAELSWSYDAASRTLAVVVRNKGAAHMMPTGNHGAPQIRLMVYLEGDEPGKPPILRDMLFSNKLGTAVGPLGSATLEIPIKRLVPTTFSAHARLLFFPHEEVAEKDATVMAQKDFTFRYEPPAVEE